MLQWVDLAHNAYETMAKIVHHAHGIALLATNSGIAVLHNLRIVPAQQVVIAELGRHCFSN